KRQEEAALAKRKSEEEERKKAQAEETEGEKNKETEKAETNPDQSIAKENSQSDKKPKPEEKPAGPSYSSYGFIRPAPGRVTSYYGYRPHPIGGDVRMHKGIDISSGGQ